MKKLFPLFLLFAWLAKAHAQEPISTDRPDQSDGVYVMQPRAFQLETGFVFYRNGHDSLTHSSLLRLGIFHKTELRLVIEENYTQASPKNKHGLLPIGLATKVVLWEQKKFLPAATFSGYLRLPKAASADFVTPYWAHTALISLQYELNDHWAINQNTGILNDGLSRNEQCFVTASVTCEPLHHLIFLAEYFAYYGPQQKPGHNADLGVLYQLTDNIQFDIDYGQSFFQKTINWFVTVGFSFRV